MTHSQWNVSVKENGNWRSVGATLELAKALEGLEYYTKSPYTADAFLVEKVWVNDSGNIVKEP